MLAVTFIISGIVSRGINRDEVVVLLLEQKSAEVELWTEMTLDSPKPAGTESDMEWLLTLLIHGGVLPVSGGTPLVISPVADVGLRRILEDVLSSWNETNAAAHQLASEPNNTVVRQQFQDHNLTLQHGLIHAANIVRQRLQTNTGMIRGLFAALFLSTLAFLLFGLWFMEQIVLLPLDALHVTAHRIAAGDLDTPVALTGSGEFLKLARSFEGMRSELQQSRASLVGSARELEKEVAQRTEQFTALTHVISLASQSLEMEEMLATAMDAAINALGVEIGALWLLDKNRGDLRLAVSRGMSTTMREELRVLAIGEGATGSAVQLRQTIVLEDISQEPHAVHPVTVRENIFSLIAAPVMVRDRILGAVDVATRQKRRFAPVEVALLTSIGQHIGVAVDGLQLLTEARGQAQSLAQLHEREKISAELHDGLLQTLSYLYLKIDQLGNAATNAQYTQLERQ
ncbi:MAG: GAF domain-containing protein, partial [Anaerolineales bacterium]|nr:GAF domain-containing protein [Anaerolineales bacterium]